MKRLVGLVGVLSLLVLAATGCGGDGSSGIGETTPVAEAQDHLTKKHHASTESPEAERREQKENREFREREEERIARQEEQEQEELAEQAERKEKAKQKHRKMATEPEPATSSEVDPIAAEELHYFTGTDLGNWEIAYGICAVTPEKQLAKEFHTEQNWGAIGHAYGQGYREPFNIAAEEGCMVALKDSEPQREAMFALMEENE